jgi:hypothetical protein
VEAVVSVQRGRRGATQVQGARVSHGGPESRRRQRRPRVAGGVGPVGARPALAHAHVGGRHDGRHGGLRPPVNVAPRWTSCAWWPRRCA